MKDVETIWFNKAIGKRMKFLRKSKKLSQSQVGEMMGVTFQQIQKYEKGDNALSLKRAEQFVRLFNLTLPYLTDDIDKSMHYLRVTTAVDDSVTSKEVQ